MSAMLDLYLSQEKLELLLKEIQVKKTKGVVITLSINDASDKYGQNVSAFISQTKEERDSQKPKDYVGNGKVFYVNGNVTKAVRHETQQSSNSGTYDEVPY